MAIQPIVPTQSNMYSLSKTNANDTLQTIFQSNNLPTYGPVNEISVHLHIIIMKIFISIFV